jgi:hypothetical protein
MNCDEAQQRWHDSYDSHGVDPDLQGHLATCETCLVYAKKMECIVVTLDAMQAETESIVSMNAGDLDRHRHPILIKPWRFLIQWATGIAAAIGLLVGTSLLFEPKHNIEHQPVAKAEPTTSISLEGASIDRYMVVARATTDPNVQLYWLYPTLSE